MKQDKIKHLEFIQSVITRMNTNSFQIKALTVTIVSALIVLYASSNHISLIIIAIAPALVFWFLDSYYLQQERKFRGVYNDVAEITNEVDVNPFEMPIQKYKGGKYRYSNAFTSNTIIWFYLPIITLLLVAFCIIYCSNNLVC